jgi:hypothetical protein
MSYSISLENRLRLDKEKQSARNNPVEVYKSGHETDSKISCYLNLPGSIFRGLDLCPTSGLILTQFINICPNPQK